MSSDKTPLETELCPEKTTISIPSSATLLACEMRASDTPEEVANSSSFEEIIFTIFSFGISSVFVNL